MMMLFLPAFDNGKHVAAHHHFLSMLTMAIAMYVPPVVHVNWTRAALGICHAVRHEKFKTPALQHFSCFFIPIENV
jgi:hypothetical protein